MPWCRFLERLSKSAVETGSVSIVRALRFLELGSGPVACKVKIVVHIC